jgi:MoxR-like ATPase
VLTPQFASVADVSERLSAAGYLTDDAIATTVFLADRLGKPLLVEGPAGVGKTELAKAVAEATGSELIRLQCYEGLDEARALYEWNYKKQLLRIQASKDDDSWDDIHDDVFAEEFLLSRPLLTAIRRTSRPCCSSTRPTRPTSRSRACCWRCCRTSRSPSPSSAPSPPPGGRSSC